MITVLSKKSVYANYLDKSKSLYCFKYKKLIKSYNQ